MQSNKSTAPAGKGAATESNTVEIPLSSCPDCQPGDTLQFKVVSIDQNSGVITATPMEGETPDQDTADQGGGSDSLAQDLGTDQTGEQS